MRTDIPELRKQIDALDEQICQLLVERCQVSQQIQLLKKKNAIPLRDHARELLILTRLKALHPQLPHPLLEKIYQTLFESAEREGL